MRSKSYICCVYILHNPYLLHIREDGRVVKALRLGIISIRSGKPREFEPHSSQQYILFFLLMAKLCLGSLTMFRVTAS